MTCPTHRSPTPLDSAVAQIPRGLFLVAASWEGHRTGVLAQWVQQCSLRPPMIMIAMERGQPIEPLIRDSRNFVICQIARDDRLIPRKFAAPPERGDDPFVSIDCLAAPSGSPVPRDSVAYLDCELVCQLELEADHRVFVGHVLHGEVMNQADPAIFFGLNGSSEVHGDGSSQR